MNSVPICEVCKKQTCQYALNTTVLLPTCSDACTEIYNSLCDRCNINRIPLCEEDTCALCRTKEEEKEGVP